MGKGKVMKEKLSRGRKGGPATKLRPHSTGAVSMTVVGLKAQT